MCVYMCQRKREREEAAEEGPGLEGHIVLPATFYWPETKSHDMVSLKCKGDWAV